MKPTKKEVYDLIKFCTEDNRVCIRPHRAGILWGIIEGDKQRDKPEIFDKIRPLVLYMWTNSSSEQKRITFHEQIKFAGFYSPNKEKVFYKLKDFLHNLEKEFWLYDADHYKQGKQIK